MNIKTLYFICEKYLEKIHPNNEENEENEEDLEEIAIDLKNDFAYLCECARCLILKIKTTINEIITHKQP
jgi:hypothetical protein